MMSHSETFDCYTYLQNENLNSVMLKQHIFLTNHRGHVFSFVVRILFYLLTLVGNICILFVNSSSL